MTLADIATSLEIIMALGEMDLFAQPIHDQAGLPGLQEVPLTDYKGQVAYPNCVLRQVALCQAQDPEPSSDLRHSKLHRGD